MIMKHVMLPLIAALFPFVGVAGAFQVDFSKDGTEALFDASAKALPKRLEGLVSLPASIETLSLPVEAGKKYKLEIAAEVAGDFVTELNDRAHILTLQSHLNRLTSTYEVIFQDANGKEIPGLGGVTPGATPSLRGFFLTNQRQPYIAVFYAPAEAASLKVRFQSKGRSTRIASLHLAEEGEEKTVNPNPDFRYGELNYTGWQPQRDGRLYTRPDGKSVLNTGYGGTSPFFPLHSGSKYRVSAIGEGDKISIQYFDKGGKSILSRFLFRPSPKGVETELIPPPGSIMARIVVYNVILEEFRVAPLK